MGSSPSADPTAQIEAALAAACRSEPVTLVTGKANVPIDCYDAIEILSQRTGDPIAALLAKTARVVADLWNDPDDGWALMARDKLREDWPTLAVGLDELLGGGPIHPPVTLADVRAVPVAISQGPHPNETT